LKNFFIIKKHPLVKETFMERRQIVAAIVKIANQLDEMGMYSEANELTKVAQAAGSPGSQVMKGFGNIYEGVSRGVGGLARDTGKALKGTYDATKQGLSDAGELMGEGASNLGFGMANPATELGLGASEISDNMIENRIQRVRDLAARHDNEGASEAAKLVDSNIDIKIKNIRQSPGGGSQAAKDKITQLMQKQFEIRKYIRKDLKGTGLPMALRGQANQLMNTPDLNDYIYNRASKRPLTRVQLYDMAKQEHGETFANSVAAKLSENGFTGRDQIIKPSK
jgi:hypothetical protein